MATHDTHNLGHPVDTQGEYPTQRVSQRRSSSSSSGSQTGQTTAPPQSHTSSHPPISFPSVTNGTTEVPAFQLHQKNVPISSVLKGKQKESVPMDRPASFHTGEGGKREYRSTWIVDEESSMIGADAWVERDRVVLVLGRPTPDSLSPLLYNPQYASTLILIALSSPSVAFTQLAAQTTSDRTTYPIVQLVDLKSIAANNPAHPLPSLLEKAAKIATQWRASLSGPSTPRMSWMGAGSRTSSAESISSGRYIPPPSSNRSSMAPPSAYRRSSDISTESTYDSRRMSAPVSRTRPEPSSRKSSFFGLGKTSETRAPPPASPFDAVLHFIPPASEFSASRALQEMLQRSILLTSTVVPTLAKRDMSSSKDVLVDSIPVSLVHVLPANPPAALPTVIENFVLSLLSGFQSQSERPLTSVVINEAAWLHPAERDIMSGSDLVLFGGAKVRPTELPDGTTRTKSRAFIPFWPHQGPPMAVTPNPDFTRPDYSTLVPVAPTVDKPLSPRRVQRSPPSSRPSTRHHRSGLSQVLLPSDLEDISSLDAPELDHAPSSASSQSHEATTPMTSTYGSELGAPSLNEAVGMKVDTGRKSGFGSFVRRFGKKK